MLAGFFFLFALPSLLHAVPPGDIIRMDVTKKYPKVELRLQDIASVEYLPLETTNTFLLAGGGLCYIDEERIFYINRPKDILVFDRKGKGIKVINHRGGGAGEYSGLSQLTVDKANKELFVSDMWMTKIFVYDWDGNYKRSFWHAGGQYSKVEDFNKDLLLCYSSSHVKGSPAFLVSKKDGQKVKNILTPYKERLDPDIILSEGEQEMTSVSTVTYPLIRSGVDMIINETSTDTIYKLLANKTLSPYILRSPAINKMEVPVFLYATLETNRYQFLLTIKKEYDPRTNLGFPTTGLLFDKKERVIQDYEIYNDDYTVRQTVYFDGFSSNIMSESNTGVYRISAERLLESYQKGELRGKLKEIASKLKEDDNPVLVIVRFKE